MLAGGIPTTRGNGWGEGITDFPLAGVGAAAVAAVCAPFPGLDVDLEVVGAADGAEV